MRLWHRDLIPYLPKMQLMGQWRELCCIASNLASQHTPNHILVNPILDYPPDHFEAYCNLVIHELIKRNINIHEPTLHDLKDNVRSWRLYLKQELPFDQIDRSWDLELDDPIYGSLGSMDASFKAWHDNRYLRQCYYNLEEKYDRGGIPNDEWLIIFANFGGMAE